MLVWEHDDTGAHCWVGQGEGAFGNSIEQLFCNLIELLDLVCRLSIFAKC